MKRELLGKEQLEPYDLTYKEEIYIKEEMINMFD